MKSGGPRTSALALAVFAAACTSASTVTKTSGTTLSTSVRPAMTSTGIGSAPIGSKAPLPYSGRIAFDNFEDVWVVNADGSDLRRLTDEPGPEFDPSWSPDGTHIAYRSEISGSPEIWVRRADGSAPRRLVAGLSPAWSPGGSYIAYADDGGHISIIHPDGSGRRVLAHTPGGEYPTWSPDGTRIALNSNLSGDHLMRIVTVHGSGLEDLSAVGEGWQVDWSPDGRSILFTSHRDHPDNYTDVYVMRPDGSGVRRLTHNRGYTPAWSPDGTHIVLSAPGLYVMNADGSGMTKLPTPGVGETSLPDWTA